MVGEAAPDSQSQRVGLCNMIDLPIRPRVLFHLGITVPWSNARFGAAYVMIRRRRAARRREEVLGLARLRARPFFEQLQTLARHQLIIPLKRSPYPPQHSARGILIGLIWGLTPTVGIQIIGVSACWFVAGRVFNWNFNYLIALAWTIVTNPITFLPLYYVFYVTGKFILGDGGSANNGLDGYQAFVGIWDRTFAPDTSWSEEVGTYFSVVVVDWGLRLLVGSIPYAAIAAVLGYWWGLRFVVRYRRARLALRMKRHGKRIRAGEITN